MTGRIRGPDIPSMEAVLEEKQRLQKGKSYRRLLAGILSALLVCGAAVTLAVTLFFPVLQVTGVSMEPTLGRGTLVLTWKTKQLAAGELCVFYRDNQLLVKRVIGLPGDVIEIDETGAVSVNGSVLDEPYVSQTALGNCDITFPYQVPEDSYFVLGDNRAVSIDSRSSIVGCVSREQITGKVLFKLWPPGPVPSH